MKRSLHFMGLASLSLIEVGKAAQIKCPKILCEEQDSSKPVKQDLCYEHDVNQPVEFMKMHTCEWYQTWGLTTMTGLVSCEFDLATGQWAWVDEYKQHWGGKGYEVSETVDNSGLNLKRTKAYCHNIADFYNNMNNGRSCTAPWECVFQTCEDGFCTGLAQSEFCNSHADCNAQMFCQKGTVWPWTYRCAKLRTSYEQCQSTFECSVAHYCWYASNDDRNDNVRKCLPLYSQDHGTRFGWDSEDWQNPTFEDFRFNGQYCKTGIAFPETATRARCTSTDHIKYDGKRTESPYACDPSDNQKECQLFFNITDFIPGKDAEQSYVQTPCRCALNGEDPDTGKDGGFCGSIMGTPEYQTALAAIKPVLEKSQCHTLDRFDFRAQRDQCGIGMGRTWDEAVSQKFNINYWPYVNAGQTVKDCVEKTFVDSLSNLSKSFASGGIVAATGLILGSIAGQVLF